MDNTCSNANHISFKFYPLCILKVAKVVRTKAKLALASSAPTEHLPLLGQRQVVTCAARNINDDMIDETVDDFWRGYNSMPGLLVLFAIEVVLAPLVDASVLCKAERVISAALDLGDRELLCEQDWIDNHILS